jgi:hypothetical protein
MSNKEQVPEFPIKLAVSPKEAEIINQLMGSVGRLIGLPEAPAPNPVEPAPFCLGGETMCLMPR